MTAKNGSAGSVTVYQSDPTYPGSAAVSDLDFDFRNSSYTSIPSAMGAVTLKRWGSFGSGTVTKARVVSEHPSTIYVHVDIYVASATGEIKVVARGLNKHKLQTDPQIITASPAFYNETVFP